MSKVSYDAANMRITVDSDEVERALGDLKSKTPAVLKVAVNRTAREARRMMIKAAKKRYALNAAGVKQLDYLKQTKKASNADPAAELHIGGGTPGGLRNDMGYFKTNPASPTHFTGGAWRNGPSVWTGKVLKESSMKPLPGRGSRSKAFLAQFKSGHVGMVQRVKGSSSSHTVTEISGAPRWRNSQGKVEKLITLGSPSAAGMHHIVWEQVEPDVETILDQHVERRIQQLLAKAGKV